MTQDNTSPGPMFKARLLFYTSKRVSVPNRMSLERSRREPSEKVSFGPTEV